MLAMCCREFEKIGTKYIQVTTSSPLIVNQLKKYGFVMARKPVNFMVKNWESHFTRDFVEKIENWYITDSDGDGDAWTVDTDCCQNGYTENKN
jgi:hypothetical protein